MVDSITNELKFNPCSCLFFTAENFDTIVKEIKDAYCTTCS